MVETFGFGGRTWAVESNRVEVLESLRAAFPPQQAEASEPDFRLNLSVNAAASDTALRSPLVRGRDHLVYAAFDGHSAVLFDLQRRVAVGSVSASLAANRDYWRTVIVPIAVGIAAPVVGMVPLHAACAVREGKGLLVAGPSGAGKSTTVMALARSGFGFLSDDWTFLATSGERLIASALPVHAKLLPESRRFFPELKDVAASLSQNGELALEFDPFLEFGMQRHFACEPRWVVLLRRREGAVPRLRRATTAELIAHFVPVLDTLPAVLAQARSRQVKLIAQLSRCASFILECDGTPPEIAALLGAVCDGEVPVQEGGDALQPPPAEMPDLLRRNAPTPHRFVTCAGGVSIAIDTDCELLSQRLRIGHIGGGEFHFTVVTQTNLRGPGSRRIHYSRGALGYTSLGAEGFLATDLACRRGLAFVTPSFALSAGFLEEMEYAMRSTGTESQREGARLAART